jgi:hypothetical protein
MTHYLFGIAHGNPWWEFAKTPGEEAVLSVPGAAWRGIRLRARLEDIVLWNIKYGT